MNNHGPTTKLLFAVWLSLLVLLFVTWLVAEFDFGRWNIVVAMTVAVVKALLVILIFMHVRYGMKLTWVFVGAGFFWLFILVVLTMGDYLTRGGLSFDG
jgi:cytochrome c oxidase subunit 4